MAALIFGIQFGSYNKEPLGAVLLVAETSLHDAVDPKSGSAPRPPPPPPGDKSRLAAECGG